LSRAGKKDEASSKYTAGITPLFTALKESVQAETEFNRRGGARNSAEAAAAGGRTRSFTWAILIASLLIGSALLFHVVRGANRTLIEAVGGLRAGAEQVAASAAHISAASQSLAQGASEQAASLQETSASSEELTAMVCKNTENARRASTMVTDSEQQFLQANQAVEQMALAMEEIARASDKISQILKLIDGIAFQTNVLSLNAAVEAARAGESGLGFAVVADEVRNLAQRCAQASQDTEVLIEESIAKAKGGKARMDQVGVAIRSITQQSAGVKNLVGEVNLGSEEQARGIEEIAKAVRQIEVVTEAVAANAEESAAAAEQMSAQAQDLTGIANHLATMVGIAAPELNEEGLHICQQPQ
jgi:methyl-accepting chemotaxis protein/methyl-accepting chemotaxis protein-1 (serine sensor receptor)